MKILKTDILEGAGNAENVISLVYDAERNVRIYHSEEDGLVITRGLGAKERPIIQIDEAGDIKISTDDRIFLDAGNIFLSNTGEPGEDTEQPAVRGLDLETFLRNFITDYKAHIHPTGVGPSGTLQVPFAKEITSHINKKINNYASTMVNIHR